jgi:hypothetical protein
MTGKMKKHSEKIDLLQRRDRPGFVGIACYGMQKEMHSEGEKPCQFAFKIQRGR